MKKAIFLDRDGVINENVKDLTKPEQFKMLPNVGKAIKKINDLGYMAIIISNQPIISKGFLTFEGMEKIHERMNILLKKDGAKIDAIYVCPHHPEKGFKGEIPELKIECVCRKPKPGLILQAKKEHNIDLEESWMIGDSKVDVACGKDVGVKTILLSSGGGSGRKDETNYDSIIPDLTCNDLLDAVDKIFR